VRGAHRGDQFEVSAERPQFGGHGVRFQGPRLPDEVEAPIELRGRRHLWTKPETAGGFLLQLVEKTDA